MGKINENSFKPYYKWNTFNTEHGMVERASDKSVLNLIINGIPSIPITIFIRKPYRLF